MSFIDIDYFKGALQIPNLNRDSTSFEQNYIEYYEREVLIHLLGYDLYNQLINNYDTNNNDEWKRLVEGAKYLVTVDDIIYTVQWEGLKNTRKVSLIAYYVYYWYVKTNYEQLTGIGTINSDAENATKIDPNIKLVWSNNECSMLSGDYEYCLTADDAEKLTYESTENTLFNFIFNNIADYTNWQYKPINKINVLGI